MTRKARRTATLAATAALPLILAGCELGPKETTQYGPRGAAMEQVANLNLKRTPGVPPPSAYALETRGTDSGRGKSIPS
jgi:hypothetical protein